MSILEKIKDVVAQRRNGYGRPLINFLRIGIEWTAYLTSRNKLRSGAAVTPEDVAYLELLLKVAREDNSHDDDNPLDMVGYILCTEEMRNEVQSLGENPDILRTMSLADMIQWQERLLNAPKAP